MTARRIAFVQERLGTSVECTLLEDLAPRSAEFLWSLAGNGASVGVNHAIWTGPELSIPLPVSSLPEGVSVAPVPLENATSYPRQGDVVLAWLAAGSARGLPPGDFFDIGLFYDEGARLLMPFGWLQANVAAQVAAHSLPLLRAMALDIRQHGSSKLHLQRL